MNDHTTQEPDHSPNESPPARDPSRSAEPDHGLVRSVLPWLLVLVAIGIGVVLLKTPPQVPKASPVQVAAVVGVADLKPQTVQTTVEAYGTVVAARQTRIQPEVAGRIITLHPRMIPGGLIGAGEVLFEIDTADYEIAVTERAAEVEVAREQIEGLRAGVAATQERVHEVEAELEYLRWNMDRLGSLSENNQAGEAEARDAQSKYAGQRAALAALRAQVMEQEHEVKRAVAQAAVAESRLAAARLALQRTRVQAPFDAIVLNEAVELGQLVDRQTVVATLAATDTYWVEASVPAARLDDIRFADTGGDGSSVTITMALGERTVRRSGVVLRPLGDLDPQGRMARVLVAIRDPLALREGAVGQEDRILLGSYVRLAIEAGVLQEVYAIPRYALRENSRVWVRDAQGKLGIRRVDIVWRRQEDVLVRDGFSPGDELVTTHLASVVPGMPLDVRTEDDRGGVAAGREVTTDDS